MTRDIISLLETFHFLRPTCLLLLLPIALLTLMLYRKASSGVNWRRAIAPELIDYLLEPATEQRRHWLWLVFAGWVLATLALAGPTWEQTPQPALQKRDGLVIVLDLSLSMYAEDIKPSRLQRARYKILDILRQRREGLTGLVVYSGDAHVVTPLTDDSATIANLVPALAPVMMPTFGSNANAGVEQAIQLLRNAGFERGRVLLISDEIDEANSAGVASQIKTGSWQLSILSVGTDQGAPIPIPNGFLKNPNGSIVIAQLHREKFQALSQQLNASYADLSLDDNDINTLLPDSIRDTTATRTLHREFDQWRERGPQIVLLLLPLAAFAFRRGWLLALLLLPLSAPSQAIEWRELWQRPDQQAQQLFSTGNTKDAAQKFTDPAWRAAAQYRSGDYDSAAQTLQSLHGADAHYNRGNALAQAGKLQEAIAAYDAALKENPAMEDAKVNRELVQKQLQQQKNTPPQQNASQQQQQQQKDNTQQQQSTAQQDNGNQQQSGASQQDNSSSNRADEQSNIPSASSEQKDSERNQPAQKHDANDGQSPETAQSGQPEKSTQSEKENSERNADADAVADKNGAAQPGQTLDEKSSKQTAQNHADATDQQRQQLQQQRATEQWLRQIPDDPAGLLRRKFLYESRQQQRGRTAPDDQPIW